MRNILNIITDVLTLIAVSIAAIGVVGFSSIVNSLGFNLGVEDAWFGRLRSFTQSNMVGAGIFLGLLGLCIMVSLVAPLSSLWRRFLTLAMFATSFATMLFLIVMATTFDKIQFPQNIIFARWDAQSMLMAALIPTGFAIFFSLVRMIWSMPPERSRAFPTLHAQHEARPLPYAAPAAPALPAELPDLPLERIGDRPPHTNQGIRSVDASGKPPAN